MRAQHPKATIAITRIILLQFGKETHSKTNRLCLFSLQHIYGLLLFVNTAMQHRVNIKMLVISVNESITGMQWPLMF